MTLSRSEVLQGVAAELQAFSALLTTLTTSDLERPSRCAGWTIRDVAAHVVGTAVDVAAGDVAGQGTAAVTARQAQQREGRSAVELADELDAARPALLDLLTSLPETAWEGPSLTDPSVTLGFAVEAIWYDAYVHAEDVRAALGREAARGPGLLCAVHHVAGYLEQQHWPPTTWVLEGLAPVHVSGGGQVVHADPLDLVLAATGRLDPSGLGLDPRINVYANAT